MPSVNHISTPWICLLSDTTASIFIPVTKPFSADRVAKIRGEFELRYRSGLIGASLAYQTCQTPASYDTATACSSTAASEGITYPVGGYQDVLSKCGKRKLVRLGYLVNLATGTTLSFVYAQAEFDIIEP